MWSVYELYILCMWSVYELYDYVHLNSCHTGTFSGKKSALQRQGAATPDWGPAADVPAHAAAIGACEQSMQWQQVQNG